MAEGRSNRGIAEVLVVTPHAVEKHVTGIFSKLGLADGAEDHRRVLAVLDVPPLIAGSGRARSVPPPGGLSTSSVPSSAPTRSPSPRSPLPPAASAPPTPSSRTSTTARRPRAGRRPARASRRAYLATFVSASATTK